MSRSRKRAARQAELGEVEESAAATYERDPEAADEVAAELCDAIRDVVAYVLQPSTVWELCWSSAGSPTIMDVQVLAADPLFSSLAAGQRERLLDDQSAQTAVERGDGILPAVRIREPQVRLASVAQLAAVFQECVAPASLEASTRRGYQALWRTVLTWGIAHEIVADLLPMSRTTLTALTQEMLMVGCSAGTIKNLWSSIEDRHRRFGLAMPPGRGRRVQATLQGRGGG